VEVLPYMVCSFFQDYQPYQPIEMWSCLNSPYSLADLVTLCIHNGTKLRKSHQTVSLAKEWNSKHAVMYCSQEVGSPLTQGLVGVQAHCGFTRMISVPGADTPTM